MDPVAERQLLLPHVPVEAPCPPSKRLRVKTPPEGGERSPAYMQALECVALEANALLSSGLRSTTVRRLEKALAVARREARS